MSVLKNFGPQRRWRIVLPLLAPILGLVYGTADQMKVLDNLRGRSSCLRAYERLCSPYGFPQSFIYRGDPDFAAVEKLLISKTENETVRDDLKSGKRFVLITRGDVSIPLKSRVPADFPDPTFVPDASPVLLISGELRDKTIHGGVATYASSLGDIRRWIDDGRNLERFTVSTVLIALLGIIISFLEARRTGDDAHS